MARKEGLILLLDVGPTMHGVLHEVEKLCLTLLQKKLVYHRSDEVGIVLYGTEETKNDLEKEVGGYEHVVVAHDLKVVDGETAEALCHVQRGTKPGDFVDAIVVGMDMLIKKYGNKNHGKQRLCLITDARCPVKAPSEGTKENQIDDISEEMKKHGIRLDCTIFREPRAERDHVMEENDRLLARFSGGAEAKIVPVDNPTALLGALKTRHVSPVTIFRGDLELSPIMKIKVWVYKKTSEEKFPTLKKYSDKAPLMDKFATHEIKVDFEYKDILQPDKVVPPEQRVKGYRYGPQVIPLSSSDWEAVKFKPEKSVKLLGVTDVSNILRHQYMKDVYIFIPEPGNQKSMVAASALARSMKETNKCAILRCVWRQGQANVVIGVLTPNISLETNVPDSFYLNVLPFAEDVREFPFRSFDNLPEHLQLTEEQEAATDNFVRMLDLAPPGRGEILTPDLTPNPMLERFYNFLDLKSKQPNADIPPLDSSLKRITEPEPDLMGHQAPLIQNLCKIFELKDNPKKKKGRAWNERTSLPGLDNHANLLEPPEDSSTGNIGTIGDENPVKDFEAMLSCKDGSKWVRKAIEVMEKYTTSILENSFKGNIYQKALACFVALRKACIIEQEPMEFNRYLTELYERWITTDLADFFKLLSSNNVTLISKEEAPDSDVTEEKAKSFYVKDEPFA